MNALFGGREHAVRQPEGDPQLRGDLPEALAASPQLPSKVNVEPNRLPTETNATTTSRSQTRDGSLSNEFPLKLRDGGEDVEEEPPVGCRRVDAVLRRHEVNPESPQFVGKEHEVTDAAREPVELVDGHDIDLAAMQVFDEAVELGAPVLHARDPEVNVLADDLPSPLFGKCADSVELKVSSLVTRAHARIDGNSLCVHKLTTTRP